MHPFNRPIVARNLDHSQKNRIRESNRIFTLHSKVYICTLCISGYRRKAKKNLWRPVHVSFALVYNIWRWLIINGFIVKPSLFRTEVLLYFSFFQRKVRGLAQIKYQTKALALYYTCIKPIIMQAALKRNWDEKKSESALVGYRFCYISTSTMNRFYSFTRFAVYSSCCLFIDRQMNSVP